MFQIRPWKYVIWKMKTRFVRPDIIDKEQLLESWEILRSQKQFSTNLSTRIKENICLLNLQTQCPKCGHMKEKLECVLSSTKCSECPPRRLSHTEVWNKARKSFGSIWAFINVNTVSLSADFSIWIWSFKDLLLSSTKMWSCTNDFTVLIVSLFVLLLFRVVGKGVQSLLYMYYLFNFQNSMRWIRRVLSPLFYR